MFRKIFLVILTMTAVFAGSVSAVGLGEINSKSNLNQSLQAEIVLLSAGDLAEQEIKATMASQAEFEKLGIDKPFFLNKIKFQTYRKDNGQLAIKLTSREAIKEPFLNFVVELNWPNGRLLREYTILLDPPVYQDSGGSTMKQAQSSPSRDVRTAEPKAPPVRYSQSTSVAPTITGTTYGPVKEADTLWRIATRARPDSSVSIHQTLVAIYRANPEAFANGNINNLLKGKVLTIPDVESIRAVPQRAALQDVVMQNRQWRSGGARRVVDQTGSSSSTSSQASNDSGRLSLSAANDSGDASGYGADDARAEIASIKSKLNNSEEQAATLEAENEELRTRLADALKKLEDIQSSGAVNVEDADLAALANQDKLVGDQSSQQTDELTTDAEAADAGTADALTDDATLEGSDQASTEAGQATADDAQLDTTTDDTSGGAATDNTTAETATENTTTAAETKPKNPMATFPEPIKEKGLFDSIMDNSLLLGGGLGVVALILIGVFWQMRKRMEEEEFQDDLVASAGAGSMDTTETFELPEVGDDMLVELDMDDEDQSSATKDEEFDPLGEADIYIAYGKYEEAETLLLDAIDDNPVRSDFKVKLLECYAEQDNKEKFDSLASEVSEAVDAAEWMPQVEELRSQAWESSAEQEDEFDLPSTEDIFGDDSADSAMDDVAFDSDDSGSIDSDDMSIDDFSLDDNLGKNNADAEAGEDILDLEDSEDETTVFDSIDDDMDEDSSADLNASDEMDFALDDDAIDDALEGGDEDISFDDSDDISLDMDDDFGFDEESDEDDLSSPITEEGDEVSTKLDLARAYIDMGDAEGAKEILAEVATEGNDEQQSEAKALLDKIG